MLGVHTAVECSSSKDGNASMMRKKCVHGCGHCAKSFWRDVALTLDVFGRHGHSTQSTSHQLYGPGFGVGTAKCC